MNKSLKYLLNQLPPFIILGITITCIVAVFIVLSYVLLWGLIVGGVLWLIAAVYQYFTKPTVTIRVTKRGRIIDYEEKE